MPANPIQRLTVEFTANTAKLVKGVDTVNRKLTAFEKRALAAGKALKGLAGIAAGGIGAGFIRNIVQSGDRLAKFARTVGLSTDALQEFQFAAERSGLGTDQFQAAVARLQKTIADANDGLSTAADAFNKLGIDAGKFAKLDTATQILVLADALRDVEQVSERASISMALFGESAGQRMLNFVEAGSAGIAGLGEELRRTSGVIDRDALKAMEDFEDGITNVGTSIQVFVANIVGPSLPQIKAFFDALNFLFTDTAAVAMRDSKIISDSVDDIVTATDKAGTEIKQSVGETTTGIQELFLDTKIILEAVLNWLNSAGPVLAGLVKSFFKWSFEELERARALAEEANAKFAASMELAFSEDTVKRVKDTAKAIEEVAKKTDAARESVTGTTPVGRQGGAGAGVGRGVFAPEDAHIRTWEEWTTAVNTAEDSLLEFIKGQERQIKLNDETLSSTERLWTQYHRLDEALIKLAEKDSERAKQLRELIELNWELLDAEKKRQEEMAKAAEIGREVGTVIASAFEDAILAGEDFRDVLKAIAKDLLRLGTRKLISEPIIEGFSQFAQGLIKGRGGGGGAASNSFFASLGGFIGGIFGFAQHGGFPSISRPTIVGEGGPELFVPTNAGYIVPNYELANFAEGGGVTVNMTVNTPDADSFRQSRSQIAAEIGRAATSATRRMR